MNAKKSAAPQLRAALPEGLKATLRDDELDRITSVMHDALVRQAASLEKAKEDALAHVPSLLRGVVRKVLS